MVKFARGLALSLSRGFTLIELMVVIAIIAILAVVGITVYRGVNGGVRDARRKADVNAIAKAYEVKKMSLGNYAVVSGTNFASGNPPTPPEGGTYFSVTDGTGFKVCAALEANPSRLCNSSAANCYCILSTQGPITNPGGITGDHTELGVGGGVSSSCDTNGTLLSGLMGYWNLDESTGAIAGDSSGNGYAGTAYGTTIETGRFGNARRFNGLGTDYIDMGNNTPALNVTSAITMSAWVKLYAYNTNGWDCRLFGKQIYQPAPSDKRGYAIQYGTGIVWGVVGNGTAIWQEYNAGSAQTVVSPYWRHLVVTYDSVSGQTFGYADGTKVYGPISFTPPINPNSTGHFYLNESPFNCNAAIDDVRIYNRVLSQSEVALLAGGCLP